MISLLWHLLWIVLIFPHCRAISCSFQVKLDCMLPRCSSNRHKYQLALFHGLIATLCLSGHLDFGSCLKRLLGNLTQRDKPWFNSLSTKEVDKMSLPALFQTCICNALEKSPQKQWQSTSNPSERWITIGTTSRLIPQTDIIKWQYSTSLCICDKKYRKKVQAQYHSEIWHWL